MKTNGSQVFPKPPRPVSEEEKNKIYSELATMYPADISTAWVIGCCGFVVGCSVSLGIIIIGLPGTQIPSGCALVPGIALGIVLGLLTKYQLQKQVLNRRERELLKRYHQLSLEHEREAIEDANQLAAELRTALEEIPLMLKVMTEALESAEGRIKRVEEDFQARAFIAFWDGVESVSRNLRRFHHYRNKLRFAKDAYLRALEGEEHTFPDHPVDLKDLPDPIEVERRLMRVTKAAKKDFQFATIYQLRRSK